MMRPVITYLMLCCALLLIVHCTTEKDERFLIQPDQVGYLTRGMPADSIEIVFRNDSIVRDSTPKIMGSTRNKTLVFEKGGAHLLTVTTASDSLKKIENIQIHDPRYVTAEGIGLNSTFKEIKDSYEIRKVVTSLNNVVLFVRNSDLYFTISKDQLPGSLRYNTSLQIEAVQIPDKAKLKYIMVGW